MNAREFVGQTTVLGPPRGWDNSGDQTQCGSLPVQVIAEPEGTRMVSCWQPTPEEIEALRAGAVVCLSIFGSGHPPVSLFVTNVELLP